MKWVIEDNYEFTLLTIFGIQSLVNCDIIQYNQGMSYTSNAFMNCEKKNCIDNENAK